jgi:hypothetical protein
MKIRRSLPAVAFGVIFLFPIFPGYAYVPTPGELRLLWERERKIKKNLLLEYQLEQKEEFRMRFYLTSYGVWSKEIFKGEKKEEWVLKRKETIWIYRQGRWIEQPRREIHWDDWLFELDLSFIERLLPSGFFFTRGVGEYEKKNWIWIYGAHHHLAPPIWVGFLSRPLRPALVREEKLFVRCIYGNHLLFPASIEIQRGKETWRFSLVKYEFSPPPDTISIPSFLLPER